MTTYVGKPVTIAIGTVKDGKIWNGKSWVAVQGPAPTVPKSTSKVVPQYPGDVPVLPRIGTGKTTSPVQTPGPTMADLKAFERANPQLIPKPQKGGSSDNGGGSGSGSGGGSSNSGGVSPTSPTTMGYQPAAKMSGAELAAMYGITQDRGAIEKVLNEATNAKFNELDAGTRKLRDQQLTDYASQFDQYQQYARQGRSNAMKTGLNRGSAVAQDIMSQVNAQRGGAENQQFYQQGLADLVNQRGTQLGADKFNSLNMSNEIGMGLGNMGATFHQSDTAGLTGYQQYMASLANADAMKAQASISANASRYAADRGYAAATEGGNYLQGLLENSGLPDSLKGDVSVGNMTYEEAMKIYKDSLIKPKIPMPGTGGYYTAGGKKVG